MSAAVNGAAASPGSGWKKVQAASTGPKAAPNDQIAVSITIMGQATALYHKGQAGDEQAKYEAVVHFVRAKAVFEQIMRSA